MKRIAVLGSTGSIGQSTLEVIRSFPADFRAVALATSSNIGLLDEQIKKFRPEFVCVNDIKEGLRLKSRFKGGDFKLFLGPQGCLELLKEKSIDEVMLAISGSAALEPLLAAIEQAKVIALANKEALVMAGDIIMRRAAARKAKIIPVDSEQSAIWQCLEGSNQNKLKRIYLTGSGGPFRNLNKKELKAISVAQALRHPRWKMGRKITIDSATLMNKGLELIEAVHLFNTPYDKIKILIHPQAVIHSMVEFMDGVVLAQLSAADMRIPIQYSLSYPKRLSNNFREIDFCRLKEVTFQEPDFKKFPCLGLAYRAAAAGGTLPSVLNAANEISVKAFLDGRIRFLDIPKVIAKVMDRHKNTRRPNLDDILAADGWARAVSHQVIERLN